ncbi:PEP/pyruvate-binding domain-containing protein [Polaribacter sp. KT 15]|uniref:PEP/pyruvate-binding domain-containing protein n=1 Tax=Polaribacter sp. KT 15 TaxID=1896175 RepID=UPI00090BC2EA|nr:PEP/pyruvate-binding domain-containing protein [Polaribacter sp. KT 15]SHN02765.1 Pyruvate phosphate dikinase, PEP/pyruvate binding domain [Polaribacter sp. KT 15]
MKTKLLLSFAFALLFGTTNYAQQKSNNDIKKLISSYKNDIRGPYYRIKWYCKDGSVRDSKDPCPDSIGGGIQHASFKESALDLRKTNHLFFGEILASLNNQDFLDSENNYSRLKQYQLGKYLASIDDGWVLKKGQYYRGSVQSEDEEAWGKQFFETVLKDDSFVNNNYYLVRQALKDIPHNGDSNIAQKMRSESKVLAEEIPEFMDIRIKIHGNPEKTDIYLVESFIKKNASKIDSKEKKIFDKLLQTMQEFYAPLNYKTIANEISKIMDKNNVLSSLNDFLNEDKSNLSAKDIVIKITENLDFLRYNITLFNNSKDRLALLDLTNQLEKILLIETQKWQPATLEETILKTQTLTCASYATGLVEAWEFDLIKPIYATTLLNDKITLKDLNSLVTSARRVVEWSTSLVKANYQETVNKYADFESFAYGFIDDRIRNSVTLNLGETVSKLNTFASDISNVNNNVMNISNQGAIRGLNPGYAFGKLIVVDGNPENIEVNTNNIYIFQKPPSDLKPVAGIMTVSEGNLVSHVQLLARNLGIPNAALSSDNLKSLEKYANKNVFYAVSNKGNVILKLENDMSDEEQKLFNKKERTKNMITVPTDKLRLEVSKIINMKDVKASDSGILCGPKAANLGELKNLFPNKVVDGIIIPFGVFKSHMNKEMPSKNKTYWQFLNETFNKATQLKKENVTEDEIEKFVIASLKELHTAILNIDLDASFIKDLKSNFSSVFGDNLGNVPVFLRSDTNMEDLKEFTGAGLNLTLFNILKEEKIINGIKQVWASAYSERSFKWRQKYLLNPENVYPSILIIPSVDVDYSGVMITKGINEGAENDLTVAFSRGAGGAVDGQSAETRLITDNSSFLLSPARQPDYIRLPATGNTKKCYTTFNKPILNYNNINEIRELASEIREKIGKQNDDNHAYDVEFGFKDDKLWLFQIRPFVENKQAKSSDYLNAISPKTDSNKEIKLKEKI